MRNLIFGAHSAVTIDVDNEADEDVQMELTEFQCDSLLKSI